MDDKSNIDAIIEDKAKTYRQLSERDPASETERRKVNDVFRIYSTNAIEGSTLTEGETAELFEKGTTANGKPLNDHLDALATREAVNFARKISMENRQVNVGDIRNIHEIVMSKTHPEIGGQYATSNRSISGKEGFLFPGPHKIVPLMLDLGDWLADLPPSVDNAIEAHARLVAIHPFQDGNGRTSRILTDTLLERDGYPALIIDPIKDRGDYLKSIGQYTDTGDIEPFNKFMKERMVDSLDRANSFLGRVGEQRADREIGKAVSHITGLAGKVSFKDLAKTASAIQDPIRRAAAENMVKQLRDRTSGQTANLPDKSDEFGGYHLNTLKPLHKILPEEIAPARKKVYSELADFSERNRKIIKRYARGFTLQEVGDEFSITRERVRQIIRPAIQLGIIKKNKPHMSEKALKSMREKGRSRRGNQQQYPERNAEIVRLVGSGLSCTETGKVMGVSRSTVCSVIYRHNRRKLP